MTDTPLTPGAAGRGFGRVLLHLDSIDGAIPVLDHVAGFVTRAGASLMVVAVAPEVPFVARHLLPGELQDILTRQRQDDLQAAVEYFRERGVTAESRILTGKPALAVIQEVLRGGHELIVRAHRARTASGRIAPYGPIDMQLLRKCPAPLWLMTGQPCRRIMAAIDPIGGPDEHEPLDPPVLDLALRIADIESASVIAVHVWQLFGESLLRSHLPRQEFEEYLRLARREAVDGVANAMKQFGARASRVETQLVKGDPRLALPRAALDTKADLVVMGTVGRTGIPGYVIGNTAEAVVRKLRCSLLALKPEGFVAPFVLDDRESSQAGAAAE